MRMWMVNPTIMCRKHLLGEHVELHMFVGTLRKGNKITGYIENDLIEPNSIWLRHEILAEEMISRGFNHKSPLNPFEVAVVSTALPENQKYHMIDKEVAEQELISRCKKCKDRAVQYYTNKILNKK